MPARHELYMLTDCSRIEEDGRTGRDLDQTMGTHLEEGDLVLTQQRVKARHAFRELDNQLDGQDRHLGHMLEPFERVLFTLSQRKRLFFREQPKEKEYEYEKTKKRHTAGSSGKRGSEKKKVKNM